MSVPTDLANSIKKNKQLRSEYLFSEKYKNKCETHDMILKQNIIITKKKNHKANYIKSKSKFTIDDLNRISSEISLEYTNSHNTYNSHSIYNVKNDSGSDYDNDIDTISELEEESSYEIINYTLTLPDLPIFENFDSKFSGMSPLKILERDYDTGIHPIYKVLSVPQRLQKMFMDCVRTIHSLDIEICAIMKNLENYHHGNNCCMNDPVFIFSCRKNNFEFKFTFVDDGDSPTGCFHVGEITNISTKNKLNFSGCYFDITTDYTKNYKFYYNQQKFLAFIDGVSETQFRNTFYGPLLRIPQLLVKLTKLKIYVPTVSEDYFNKEIYRDYYIKIKNGDTQFILFPNVSGDGIELYFMDFVPKRTYEYVDKYYSFIYKTDSDIDTLINYINAYINRISGKYGYLENGKYFNNTHVISNFSDRQLKLLSLKHTPSYLYNMFDLYCDDTMDIDNMLGFDIFFVLGETVGDVVKINMPFTLDYYGVRFLFDKRVDPFNCVLTISTICKNTTSNEFHKLSPLIVFHESYSDCIDIIKKLNNGFY